MLLIMESPDRGGKTTQAKLIEEQSHFAYFKSKRQYGSGVNLEQAIKTDWWLLLSVFESMHNVPDLIFDRSFISQWVYSRTYRLENVHNEFGSCTEYDKLFSSYCDRLSTLDHLIVYCDRNDYTGVVDDVVDLSKIDKLKSLYRQFFNTFGHNLNILTLHFEDGIKFNNKRLKTAMLTPWQFREYP